MPDSFLLALWTISLVMAAVSLLVLATLVIHRLLSSRVRQRRNQRRDEMMTALFLASEDHPQSVGALKSLAKSPKAISQALLEYATLVRGSDLDLAVTALQQAGAEKIVLRAARKGEKKYRQMAAEALAYFRSADCRQTLKTLVEGRKTPPDVRVSCARSLIFIGEDLELSVLLHPFQTDAFQAPLELAAVFRSIAQNRPALLIERIEEASDSVYLRCMMIEALARTDVYDALPLLENLTSDSSPRIRQSALQALGLLELPIAPETVTKALADPEAQVRAATADAIGRIGLSEHADQLVALLDDPQWSVRFSSANALAALGPEYQHRLEAIALETDSGTVRRAVDFTLSDQPQPNHV